MNIALIGMMGTMKSSAANALSAITGKQCYDTDSIIEKEENRSISEIFAAEGEEYFRSKETETLSGLINMDDIIISCGGGLPLKAENRELLKSCFVILLTATANVICSRLNGDTTRPLLSGDITEKRINELLAARQDAYIAAADIIIDTCGKVPEEIAGEIIAYK